MTLSPNQDACSPLTRQIFDPFVLPSFLLPSTHTPHPSLPAHPLQVSTPTVTSPKTPSATFMGRSLTANSVGSSYVPRSSRTMHRRSAYTAGTRVNHKTLIPA